MTVLRTKRLMLRPARAEDLDGLHAILRDPDAMQYWSTAPHPDRDTTRVWLQNMIDRAHLGLDFIWDLDGVVIGKGGAYAPPEVGFILHPAYWRQGFGHEAMTAIVAHLWATTDHPHLTADIDPRNAASFGLLTALGFRETHRAPNTFFINDVWTDSLYLAIDRPAKT